MREITAKSKCRYDNSPATVASTCCSLDPEPMLNYYSIMYEPAAAQYTERVGPPICEFTRGNRDEAFAVGMIYA